MPGAAVPPSPVVPPAPAARLTNLDAWRGAAVLWMTAFHFCFDLDHAGFLRQDFHGDPFWTVQRTAIVGLFLLCAGMGQAVAHAQGLGWPRFGRRWVRIAGAALLVTAGSWWMFPRSFIYFGVLHGLAVMLVVARLTAGAGRWLGPLGAAAIASPWIAAALLEGSAWAPAFDGRALNWLGWVTRKPFTEDYVPVFPWLGVVWWGMALGQALMRRHPGRLRGPARPGRVRRALAWLGRWSLPWYLLHQPVLIGLVSLAALAR